ncbi:MAG: nitroreductase family protein [Bacteroidaceae bacterium]|nr:nitroreductase family protein [Bacteroidaceae bacterium]
MNQSALKNILKKCIPTPLITSLKRVKNKRKADRFMKFDMNKIIKLTSSTCFEQNITAIIIKYHAIEKGLTMPNRRLGFGSNPLNYLIDRLNTHIDQFGDKHEQIQAALQVVAEYKLLHQENNYELSPELSKKIDKLLQKTNTTCTSRQIEMTRAAYFAASDASFETFSKSRRSIRSFEGGVEMEKVLAAIELAQTAPSACNRQSTRVKVITDKDTMSRALDVQGGNRGFGQLVDKLIVLTTEMNNWDIESSKGGYLDGGIYTMNLLYALHYHKIGACSLNCFFSPEKDKKMREIIAIPATENFIVMIALGNVPEHFLVANSHKYPSDQITTIY